MTITDDIPVELTRIIDSYMRCIFPFKYERTYRLIANFVSSHSVTRDFYGEYPIISVSIIPSSDGKQLRVGPSYIYRMTKRRVAEWLDNSRLKCQDITDDREYIDGSLSLPEAYERHDLSFPVSPEDVEKLQEIHDSMCNGLSTTREQGQLAQFYLSREVDLPCSALNHGECSVSN